MALPLAAVHRIPAENARTLPVWSAGVRWNLTEMEWRYG
jgi:hypothetical protein